MGTLSRKVEGRGLCAAASCCRAMQDLELFKDEDFDALRELVESTGPEWELMNDGECKVWRKPDKKNKAVMVMRASLTVPNVDPADVMGVWKDIEYRFSWDDRCARNECHSVLGDDPETQNEIGYYEAVAPTPLSNRDFVLQSGWRNMYKGERVWLYMNRSIDHEAYPEVKGVVRGISHITGIQMLQPEEGGDVSITYVTSGDVGGWIPKPVTNWVVTKAAPGLMKQMVDAARGYKQWQTEGR